MQQAAGTHLDLPPLAVCAAQPGLAVTFARPRRHCRCASLEKLVRLATKSTGALLNLEAAMEEVASAWRSTARS